MAYIHRIINRDEKLMGVAHLHWIYLVKGLIWFGVLTYLGNITESLTLRALAAGNATIETVAVIPGVAEITVWLMAVAQKISTFQTGLGAVIFTFYILKVALTEVAITDRRVVYRKGFFSVRVKQIDLEEIRGESLDYGALGRLFNYGRIKLDCRFVGDVRLPAIANADNFMKALHHYRSKTQDVLSVSIGENSKAAKLEIIQPQPAAQGLQQVPMQVQPVQQQPIQTQPFQPQESPMMAVQQTQPTPQQPQQPPQPAQPLQPEIQPEQQPPTPEVQPPTTAQAAQPAQAAAEVQAEIVAQAVAQAVEKVVPKIVEKIAEQGLVAPAAPDAAQASNSQGAQQGQGGAADPEKLLGAFDEAAFKLNAKSVEESAKARHSIH